MFVVFHRFSWFLENTAGESSPNFKLLQVWRLQKRMTSSNRIPMTKTYHLFLHRTFNSITFNKKPSVDFQSQTKWSNVRGLQRTLLTSPFTDQRSFLLLMFLLIWFILMWFFFPSLRLLEHTHAHTQRWILKMSANNEEGLVPFYLTLTEPDSQEVLFMWTRCWSSSGFHWFFFLRGKRSEKVRKCQVWRK